LIQVPRELRLERVRNRSLGKFGSRMLPSVRELAVQLSINPNTIQRAYKMLEAEGWIATVPGKGCFVCGLPAYTEEQRQELLSAFDQSVAALLRMGATRAELMARIEEGGKDNA